MHAAPKICLLAITAALALATQAVASPQVMRFDGGAYDRASAIAVDGAGNVHLGAAVDTPGSGRTFAVVKLDAAGRLLWRGTYGGSRGGVGGEAFAVAVDAAGNVYAAGYVGDGVIFNNNLDYLVVKFGPDGSERWAVRYNGPGNNTDLAHHVAVDAAGNAYVSGYSYGDGYDWATLKLSPAGAVLWTRRNSGPGSADDRVGAMALAPGGNLVVTGFTKRTGDGQTNDIETLTYDPAGTVLWQQRWSAVPTSHEIANDLDIDAGGRIAITGTTAENPGPYAVPFPVTLRYSAAGTLLQAIQGEGAGGDSVDVDGAGNAWLVGALFGTPGGSTLARYDAAGTRSWLTPLTLEEGDALWTPEVAADAAGNVTVAGTVVATSVHNLDYLTIRYGADGRVLGRHRFNGPVGGDDRVAGLALDGAGVALVTGTSWNDYGSIGGTADDIVTLRFAGGTAPPPPLIAPSGLTATATSTSAIRLRWSDNAGTETGFRIERCLGNGCTGFAQVATAGRDATEYVDGGLARNTQYSYRVRAFNAGGNSAYSNTATAKTPKR